MNFVYISPNYPKIYSKFCLELSKKGVTTLGVGDEYYFNLTEELRRSLTEYYKVDSMENISAVHGAINYFILKYGKINGLESNNEYWLENDSILRESFDIEGLLPKDIYDYKHKSKMKRYFTLAGVTVAPYVVSRDINEVLSFAETEGYPLFAKPDNGVGANGAKKIKTADELKTFFAEYPPCDYIFETYVEGNIYSYDGLTDVYGNIVFETCHHFTTPIDKLMESGAECVYRTLPEIPEKLKIAGRNTVRSFNLKRRFFHIEFFELTKPLSSSAAIGDFVGLEANMRIAGGLTPDMISAAHNFNIYEVWAKTVTQNEISPITFSGSKFCTNTSRIKNHFYKYSISEIAERFNGSFIKAELTCSDDTPFGNEEFLAAFDTLDDCMIFEQAVAEKANL